MSVAKASFASFRLRFPSIPSCVSTPHRTTLQTSANLHDSKAKSRMPSAAHPKYAGMIDMAVHTGHG